MRLFVAIPLSDQMKQPLMSAQKYLKSKGVKGNYTPVDNMHLTLAFIGEYPDSDEVAEALDEVSFSGFDISLKGFGCFGDIWWAGLESSQELEALAKKVRFALDRAGVPFDKKRFSPHITLVRKAQGSPSGIVIPDAVMTVDSFYLIRSTFGKGGMIYTPVAEIRAGKK